MNQVIDFLFRHARKIVWVVAISIGAWLFVSPTVDFARPEISHEIHSACVDGDNRWIRAVVDVRNVGSSTFKLSEPILDVHEVIPLENSLAKLLLDSAETEINVRPFVWKKFPHVGDPPAWSDAVLIPNEIYRQHVDILIPPDAKVIEITSEVTVTRETGFLENLWLSADDKNSAGQAKTIYDVGSTTCT